MHSGPHTVAHHCIQQGRCGRRRGRGPLRRGRRSRPPRRRRRCRQLGCRCVHHFGIPLHHSAHSGHVFGHAIPRAWARGGGGAGECSVWPRSVRTNVAPPMAAAPVGGPHSDFHLLGCQATHSAGHPASSNPCIQAACMRTRHTHARMHDACAYALHLLTNTLPPRRRRSHLHSITLLRHHTNPTHT